MTKEAIGFIGLGDMGEPMAARLLDRGYPVVSCAHRRRDAIEALKLRGLVERDTPRAVAEQVDVLITMVRDELQTDHVLRGPDGALAGLRDGTAIIVMSTLSPVYCQSLAAEVQPRGIRVMDCPVSGLRHRASDGTLTLIVGGTGDDIAHVQPILESLGTPHLCGGVGMGMVVKLANNAIAFGTAALVLEARVFASAHGADMDTLMAVCRGGTANSFAVQAWDAIAPALPNLMPLGVKDARICRAAAMEKHVPMPMTDAFLAQDWIGPGKG
jgi:3-hydroxyisobutyrate dehydrogenase-like beta-hydroxyacid dehydrogenase